MFWKINYIIDNGYSWIKRVCIIKAGSKEEAIEILYSEIGSKLEGESFIRDRYTMEITECDNDVILYDGSL